MGSGGAGGGSSTGLAGKKRKATSGDLPERREPRRGLGVAALETLMAVRLETAKNIFMFPPPPPPPPIGYFPGARFNPFVGNEGLQRDWHQQHYVAQQQYYTGDVFARMLQHASSGPRVDQSARAVTAAPPTPLLLQDHRRQMQARHQRQHDHRQMTTTVDLVGEEDGAGAGAGAGEELDLELRL